MEDYAKTFTSGFKRPRRGGRTVERGVTSFKVDDPALKIETTIPRERSKD